MLISLAPAVLISILLFGLRAIVMYAVCSACGIAVYILLRIVCTKNVVQEHVFGIEFTCIAACMLLGAGCPVYAAALTGVFAALCVCLIPRRAGQIFHPALCAAAIICLLFPAGAGAYYVPSEGFSDFFRFSLGNVKFSASPAVLTAHGQNCSFMSMLIGGGAGALGLTSALALIVGAMHLYLRRILTPDAPLCAVAVMALLSLLFPAGKSISSYIAGMIFTGNFLFGALFFMYPCTCAPVSKQGRRLYASLYALICFLIKRFALSDGMVSALLLLQAFTWIIDLDISPRMMPLTSIGSKIEAVVIHQSRSEAQQPDRLSAVYAPETEDIGTDSDTDGFEEYEEMVDGDNNGDEPERFDDASDEIQEHSETESEN